MVMITSSIKPLPGGLSVGLKNDVDQIPSLVSFFDWALNEECVQYNECNKYQPFFDAGKVVMTSFYIYTFRKKRNGY